MCRWLRLLIGNEENFASETFLQLLRLRDCSVPPVVGRNGESTSLLLSRNDISFMKILLLSSQGTTLLRRKNFVADMMMLEWSKVSKPKK